MLQILKIFALARTYRVFSGILGIGHSQNNQSDSATLGFRGARFAKYQTLGWARRKVNFSLALENLTPKFPQEVTRSIIIVCGIRYSTKFFSTSFSKRNRNARPRARRGQGCVFTKKRRVQKAAPRLVFRNNQRNTIIANNTLVDTQRSHFWAAQRRTNGGLRHHGEEQSTEEGEATGKEKLGVQHGVQPKAHPSSAGSP